MFHHQRHKEEEEDVPSSGYEQDEYRTKKAEYGEDYERQESYGSQDNPAGYRRESNQENYGRNDGYTKGYNEDSREERGEKFKEEEAKQKKYERLAEAEALGTGGFALYEGHEVKKDPENAGRHRLEEEIAGAGAAGGAGFGLFEHHQKKNSEEEEEELEGKKKHGWFG
ncbi:hypothetical protein O6H91_18G071000 [Diphasiastrum complanatum]|uniref:Uncharacterized protein n=2 Tax=Diphasiastrum complanatum TaxID=34168 RepID=A0ACC2B2M3_DIPCM|nr:hypothetical protein O6H91_18G071000 [Diphasiastrum complanatum]KAJ7523970.1 hypothetical protein O6H91_18G071000 [Diphasiastrum complanatum]